MLDIAQRRGDAAVQRLLREPGEVGRGNDILQAEQRVIGSQRLLREDIEPYQPPALLTNEFNSGSRRRQASISSSAISATARLLVPGRLHTAMPRRFAASTSMVLTPLPIFWISLSLGAAAMASAVTGFSTCQSTSIWGSSLWNVASSLSGHRVIPRGSSRARSASLPSKWNTTLINQGRTTFSLPRTMKGGPSLMLG